MPARILILRSLSLLGLFVFWTSPTPTAAQRFPAESPKASLTQRIGYCEVEISYSRPRVRGREIWDVLVPYGKVWRTGADYPTFVSVSTDVKIEGEALAAGRYAFYTIPNAERWTVIFSRNTELWGAFGYSADDDALRVEVTPEASTWTESFTIELRDVTARSAVLALSWADVSVPIRVTTEIHDELMRRVQETIEAGKDQDWGFYWRASKYLLENGRDLEQASAWIDKSLEFEGNWMNLWTRAEVYAAQGEREKALELGSKALEVCQQEARFCPYVKTYKARMDEW